MACIETAGNKWGILLGLWKNPKEDVEGASSGKMVYGQTLTIPGEIIQTNPQVPVSQHL